MERTCRYLFYQPLPRILVLLTVLFLTLKGQVSAPVQWRRKSTGCSCESRSCLFSYRENPDSKIASRRFPRQWPRMMQKSRILNKWLTVSQPASKHWKRIWLPPQAVPVRQALGISLDRKSDGSTATGSLGSHGPGSSEDNRNTRRRLDTFSSPDDEHARSAVLLQFLFEQYHAGVINWINNFWATSNIPVNNKPVRIHCKTGGLSARFVFETRAKCQDFVARYKDDGIPDAVESPFCISSTNIIVRSPNRSKTGESENDLRPCGKFWPKRSKISFLKEMIQVPSLSLHSTYDHKTSAPRILETAWENQFSNLLHLETNRCLILLLLTCAFLAFLMTYCDNSLCKQDIWLRMARSMRDGRPFASSPLRRLASRGHPFRGVPVWWTMQIAIYIYIYMIRSFILQDSVHCHRGCSQHPCSRPHDTLTCLFFTSL